MIPLNERHLKRLLSEYVRYYHEDRTISDWKKTRRTNAPCRNRVMTLRSYPFAGLAVCIIVTIWPPKYRSCFSVMNFEKSRKSCLKPFAIRLRPNTPESTEFCPRLISRADSKTRPRIRLTRCAFLILARHRCGFHFGEAHVDPVNMVGRAHY